LKNVESKLRVESSVDYRAEGQALDVKLLRALVVGGKQSQEIQFLLDSQATGKADYQALALALTDHSAHEGRARATFEGLRRHQQRLQEALGRPVGIRTSATDYLEAIEQALGLQADQQALSYSQLAQMAYTDYLTGLPNYRTFSNRYAEEFKRAQRYHRILSLVLLDIDHFKRFNDSFGHPAGNLALESLAGVLRKELRETDLCGRYGGEEFAVILTETTKQEALEMAERMRHAVETQPIELEEGGVQKITVSLGVATSPRDAGDAEGLMRAADEALYSAKKGGRNCVRGFQPSTSATLSCAEPARSVFLVGDFNGWNRKADPMHKGVDGSWKLELNLVPGRYAYKFFLDGERFASDPRAEDFAPDGFGGVNSVLVVG
jgi:diguanylate cyclase (GGDEF)-like protein